MRRAISTITCFSRNSAPAWPGRNRSLLLGILSALIGALCTLLPAQTAEWSPTDAARLPRISPDYREITLPPNLAPLNFTIQEPGSAYRVRLKGKTGDPIELQQRSPTIRFAASAWRRLLELNRGKEIVVDVAAQAEGGQWQSYLGYTNSVAQEEIDPWLIYRRIHPAHSTWSSMGLYQRDLRTFDESPILENRRFANDCCHCHALRINNPDLVTVDIRSTHFENSLLVISNGVATALRGNVGFVAWHPKSAVVAASFSKPRLMLHTARNDMRDIAELEGWLGYFVLGSNVVHHIPGLHDPQRLLAFPTWSPDGRYLYYGNAPNPWTDMTKVTATSHTQAKYDLMRVAFDPERNQWGRPELVLPAGEQGFSVAQPRISPDGRWLFFCSIGYGCWPTYDPTSDLYGLDLEAGGLSGKYTARRLELNSPEAESWLSWSSNSRWVVFSSKRVSPLFNRPHLAYVSAKGECTKPFIVPQRDPGYYDSLLETFTIPTLATDRVRVPQWKLVDAIKNSGRTLLTIPGAKPQTAAEAYEEGH